VVIKKLILLFFTIFYCKNILLNVSFTIKILFLENILNNIIFMIMILR